MFQEIALLKWGQGFVFKFGAVSVIWFSRIHIWRFVIRNLERTVLVREFGLMPATSQLLPSFKLGQFVLKEFCYRIPNTYILLVDVCGSKELC